MPVIWGLFLQKNRNRRDEKGFVDREENSFPGKPRVPVDLELSEFLQAVREILVQGRDGGLAWLSQATRKKFGVRGPAFAKFLSAKLACSKLGNGTCAS